MWKYLFSSFDPRFGQQPDENNMDADELEDYDPIGDTIARNHWDHFCVEEEQKAAQQVNDMSPFSDLNIDYSFNNND